jgi:hypothetical protein
MTENDVKRVLSEVTATDTSVPDPRQIVASVLRRDQRRVRTLAAACMALWLTAAGSLALLGYAVSETYASYAYIRQYDERAQTPEQRLRADQMRAIYHERISDAVEYTIYALIVGPVALVLANAVTLMLIFSSRGATLRQMNANLASICEFLRSQREISTEPVAEHRDVSNPQDSPFFRRQS